MNVLVAGGVFRHTAAELAARQPAPEVVLVKGLRDHGIKVSAWPLERWREAAIAPGFDVVHIHHLSKAALAVAMSPKSRPFVFTEHASGPAENSVHRVAQKIVMARASTVVCLSPNEADHKSSAYGIPRSRIEVIPNGIPAPAKADGIRTHAPGEEFRLIFVGQLKEVKQVDRALKALVDLPKNVVLRLVYHNNELEETLRAQADALGLQGRVSFVGQLSDTALFDEYRKAHALVLPSASEALPSVVTEALLTGLPIIASDVGGVSGQMADAGILLSPSRSQRIAPAISELIIQYGKYTERAAIRAGQVTVDYSVDSMISRHVALYRRLAR